MRFFPFVLFFSFLDYKGDFGLEIKSEFVFEMDKDVWVVYRSLKPELEATHQRSATELDFQGNSLVLRICSGDMVSMRAALNGWLRLIRIAVEMNATIES
jgi:KEOPS complex subunit Pcc1